MRFSWGNMGVLLAVFAGMLAIGFTVWPVVAGRGAEAGQGAQVLGSPLWLLASGLTGAFFLLAAGLVDRHVTLARGLLWVGIIARVVSGLAVGGLSGSPLALLLDVLPALLALGAAFSIKPIRRQAFP